MEQERCFWSFSGVCVENTQNRHLCWRPFFFPPSLSHFRHVNNSLLYAFEYIQNLNIYMYMPVLQRLTSPSIQKLNEMKTGLIIILTTETWSPSLWRPFFAKKCCMYYTKSSPNIARREKPQYAQKTGHVLFVWNLLPQETLVRFLAFYSKHCQTKQLNKKSRN